jgi:hypothetical protein
MAGGQTGSATNAVLGAVGGAVLPTFAQEFARSGVMQSAIMNPNALLAGPLATAPGILGR